jgi:hypothetical protein
LLTPLPNNTSLPKTQPNKTTKKAYAVNLTNFLVTKYTSALTLQVLGNCKGVIAAVVSVFMFKNHVTPRGCLGYAVTVAGVFLYSESKRRGKQARETATGGAGGGAVGAGGGAAAVGAGGGAASSASGTGASSGTEAGTATATATGAQFHHPQHVVSGAALLKAFVGGKGSDGGVATVTGAGGAGATASGIAGVLGGFAPMLKGRGVAQGAAADVESVALLQGGGGGAGGAGGGGAD